MDQWFQHSTDLNGLNYGIALKFDSFVPKWTESELRVYHPLQVFIIDWLLMFVNQTQVGANFRYLLL